MAASKLPSDAIGELLDDLARQLGDLPEDKRSQIEAGLQRIRALTAPANDQEPESPHRTAWLARFPDENPNPVARVSFAGTILYHNRASRNDLSWGFKLAERVSAPFLPLLEEAGAQSKPVRRDIQIGERFYSVTAMPFPGEYYVNLYGLDITERILAEQALRESENKFSIFFNHAAFPAAIAKMPEVSLMNVNDAWLKTFGFSREEVIGKTAVELGISPNVAWRTEAIAQLRSTGYVQDLPAQLRAKTGDWRLFSLNLSMVEIEGQSCLLTVLEDVTERKQAETALQKAYDDLANERNRLFAVMEALPIGIAIFDQEGARIQHNKGFEEIWGSPLPPVTSTYDFSNYQARWAETGKLVEPDEWAAAIALQKGEPELGQYLQIQRFDGKQAYVLNSGAPIRNVDKEITGSAIAIMDITRLIEIENALQESQKQLQVALRSVPLMVYTCDRQQRYTSVYQPLAGFRPEEVLGKRDDELIPLENAAELIDAKQKALDTGQGDVQEVLVPANGENYYYILTTEPIRDHDGSVTGLTCSAIDITEQKRLIAGQQEQAIQIEVQRRIMDQRERDRYAIAREIHDGPIQTLSSIMFHLQMVREVFPDTSLQRELNQFGLGIKNTIQELRNVLNELRPPALIQFGFSKVLRMYIEDFRSRFPEIGIELDITDDDQVLSNDTHLTLFRIFQAAMNNIIRHSEASRVRVMFKLEPDCFILEVQDNGQGFDQNKDYSHLTRGGHFGLVGMKERAEVIGGEFTVQSEVGQGTAIRIKAPLDFRNLR